MLKKYSEIDFVPTRDEVLLSYCKNKTVLNLGACNSPEGPRQLKEGLLLQEKISSIAKSCVGVDIDVEQIQELHSLGVENIIDANIYNLNSLSQKFDVIVCGEIIEHLENPGLALESCKKVLEKEGKLIISTPNLFSFYWQFYLILSKEYFNDDHCIGFSMGTLSNLVRRCGYRVTKPYFTFLNRRSPGFLMRLINLISRIRIGWSETLLLVMEVENE